MKRKASSVGSTARGGARPASHVQVSAVAPGPKAAAWKRLRFTVPSEDYRPVTWPPPGPYWCSGYGPVGPILVAFVRTRGEVRKFWPDARDVEDSGDPTPRFTDRFTRPEWFTPKLETKLGWPEDAR